MKYPTPGPQGYWKNRHDEPERTVAEDRAMLARMEDLVPNRFSFQGEPEPDPEILQGCYAIRDQEGVTDGWDCRWLEQFAGVLIDQTPAQIIGSCVATSHIKLLATRMLHEIVLLGKAQEFLGRDITGQESLLPFGPYSYRTGRKYAGINGRGDGSTCSGQMRGTMALGFLPCDTTSLQSDFFPEPKDRNLYRAWGANDSLMNQFSEQAQKFDLVEAPQITTADLMKRSLMEFKPVQICSGWGFGRTNKRLSNGRYIWTRRGSWAHSMQIIAVILLDGDWYGVVRNQWGKYHDNFVDFYVDFNEVERWIRQASAMAIGNIVSRQSDPPAIWPYD